MMNGLAGYIFGVRLIKVNHQAIKDTTTQRVANAFQMLIT